MEGFGRLRRLEMLLIGDVVPSMEREKVYHAFGAKRN